MHRAPRLEAVNAFPVIVLLYFFQCLNDVGWLLEVYLSKDRTTMTAQFDAAEALLKEIQADTAAVRAAVEEQKERVDKTTEEVEAVVKEMHENETKTRDEMREIRDEINNVREMLPKVGPLTSYCRCKC